MKRYRIDCKGTITNDEIWFNVLGNNEKEAEQQAHKEHRIKGFYKIISITEN